MFDYQRVATNAIKDRSQLTVGYQEPLANAVMVLWWDADSWSQICKACLHTCTTINDANSDKYVKDCCFDFARKN